MPREQENFSVTVTVGKNRASATPEGKIRLSDGSLVTDVTNKDRKEVQYRGSLRRFLVQDYWDKKNDASYQQLQRAESMYNDFLAGNGERNSDDAKVLSQNIRDAKATYNKTVKQNSEAALAVNAVIDEAMATVKSIGGIALSMPGSKYSDTAAQNSINNALTTVNKGKSMVTNVATAAAQGGPWAALAALVAEATSLATSLYENNMKYQWQQQRNTIDEVKSSERLGILRSDRNR